MNYPKFSVEDFVLDKEFRQWVLNPTPQKNMEWENWLLKYPEKLRDVRLARKIVLNKSWEKHVFRTGEMEELWNGIELSIKDIDEDPEREIVPISGQSMMERIGEREIVRRKNYSPLLAVAAILVISFLLSFLAAYYFQNEPLSEPEFFAENKTDWGVKSHLVLRDGTKVVLNSGSTIRYLPNFSEDKREVFLEGEAYFEVFKDSSRPFIVRSGNISTTALGTAFNVSAHDKNRIQVALVEGKVLVEDHTDDVEEKKVVLDPSNMVTYDFDNDLMITEAFDFTEMVAWKDGVLVLRGADQTKVFETLERWYGVEIESSLSASRKKWAYNGEFKNQSLENVLITIGYSLDFDFKIEENTVKIY